MGAKPAIKIETPQFVETDWQYQPPEGQHNVEYGLYRTLSNTKTGEMIDEYDMSWISQEEYAYYLKSFNWRYNQPNVVNTRFIVHKSKQEFCSQTFLARVYIEHVIVRLSQINDIPFPQNLYVIMQSLEGYAKIFEHSKYFIIDEDQICVDAFGNVKIWINADLSINYPNTDNYEEDKNAGEEAMVDKLIRLIAQNTDRQSQPEMSFLAFYEEKRGFKGKKFEEARVLVLTYARLCEIQIPDKFESVLNLGRQYQETVQEEQNYSTYSPLNISQGQPRQHTIYQSTQIHDNYRPIQQSVTMMPPPNYHYPIQNQQQITHSHAVYPAEPIPVGYPSSSISFGPKSYLMRHVPFRNDSNFQPAASPWPIQQVPPNAMPSAMIPNQPPFQMQPGPIQRFPNELQSESNLVRRQPEVIDKRVTNNQQAKRGRAKEMDPSKKQSDKQHLDKPEAPGSGKLASLDAGDIRVTMYNNQNEFDDDDLESQRAYSTRQQEEMFTDLPSNSIFPNKPNKANPKDKDPKNRVTNNNNFYGQNTKTKEVDDMVAKSLPLKAQYNTNNNNQTFKAFAPRDRSAHSHIQTNQHHDAFGLSGSVQNKRKEGAPQQSNTASKNKLANSGATINKNQPRPIVKYYYSLEDELQLDPDIAADMARYLAT